MSGGNKKMVQNTRERWTSTTFNREASLQAYNLAEALRRLVGMRASNFFGGPLEAGTYMDTDANDTGATGPIMRGDVFDGLVVLPQTGTLNLYVSAGIVGLDDPDGTAGSSRSTSPDPDDSRYKLVVDPGIHTNGTLVIAAGSGGATRIDIIECRRSSAPTVVETASVDIYNQVTGLFAPGLRDKVVVDRLTYRVRSGTPGGGIPASAQGWLPLCVASVPAAATTVNGMTFWDVRPLVKDRVNAPLDSMRLIGDVNTNALLADDNTNAGQTRVAGVSESTFGVYRAGGLLYTATTAYVDVRAVANQSSSYAPAAGDLWHLFAMFPTTSDGVILPRWVVYNSISLVPQGPLGIMTVTHGTNGPGSPYNIGLSTAVFPPAATGILQSGPGVLLASGFHDASAHARGFIANRNLFYATQNGTGPTLTPSATTTARDDYVLSPNVNYPRTARSIVVRFTSTFTTAAPNTNIYWDAIPEVRDPGGAGYAFAAQLPGLTLGNSGFTGPIGGSVSAQLITSVAIEIPLITDGATNGLANDDLHLRINWNALGVTARTGFARIVGWRL